ncbi:hypothetical protein Mal65_36700 [Crateriforma conspicua]|nr:hypothetical protein Mal65_36700 [Crateriforma conspicua]
MPGNCGIQRSFTALRMFRVNRIGNAQRQKQCCLPASRTLRPGDIDVAKPADRLVGWADKKRPDVPPAHKKNGPGFVPQPADAHPSDG